MRLLFKACVIYCALSSNVFAKDDVVQNEEQAECAAFLNHEIRKLHSSEKVDLCELTAGKSVLIVNTASHCGYTPQFKGLEALHKKYSDKGLVVLGFPSDDFFQEEDDEKDTAEICYVNYGVTFTMLNTVHVWGSNAHPIFDHLGDKTVSPKWNFYKYLVTDNGNKIKFFNSKVTPDDSDFVSAIEASL